MGAMKNTEVHGETEEQKQSQRLKKLSIEIKPHTLRDKTRPSNDFLLHGDIKEFLANTTATRAAKYISSTKRIIKHNVAAAVKAAVSPIQRTYSSGSNLRNREAEKEYRNEDKTN